MRVEIEDRVARELHVAADETWIETKRGECLPDLLMNDESMRVVGQGVEQEIERLPVVSAGREVPREGQTRSPVLRIAADHPLTEIDEAPRCGQRAVRALKTFEREIRAVGDRLHERFPGLDRGGHVALTLPHITEVEICRCDVAVDINDFLERLC